MEKFQGQSVPWRERPTAEFLLTGVVPLARPRLICRFVIRVENLDQAFTSFTGFTRVV